VADLFKPVVKISALNPSFVTVMSHPAKEATRGMMRETFKTFKDVDGNFIQQFQTTGFDPRVFELYLHALFSALNFRVSRPKPAPDFLIENKICSITVEAVVANPPDGFVPPKDDYVGKSLEGPLEQKQIERFPEKMWNSLKAKLNKGYWRLPEVVNRPFIIAIQSFAHPSSLLHSEASMISFIFGLTDLRWVQSESDTFEIQESDYLRPGFFNEAGSEYVSAIVFSNSGTTGKFSRMGQQGSHRDAKVTITRSGFCFDHTPHALLPAKFDYLVGDDRFIETWDQGISVFHNPKALHPLPMGIFPGASWYEIGKDGLAAHFPDFHPFRSTTQTFYSGEVA
jgi:hypothetical protein